MRGLDTLTHTRDDYSNPRCACAPRVNETLVSSPNRGQGRTQSLTVLLDERGLVMPLKAPLDCSGAYSLDFKLENTLSQTEFREVKTAPNFPLRM